MDELEIVRRFENFDEVAYHQWSATTQAALDEAFAAEQRATPVTIVDGDIEIVTAPYVATPHPHVPRRGGAVLATMAVLVALLVGGAMLTRPAGETGVATAPSEGSRPAPSAPAGQPCRLGDSCTIPEEPGSVELVPVPTGFRPAETPAPPAVETGRILDARYVDPSTTAGPAGAPARQLAVRAIATDGEAEAGVAGQASNWAATTVGGRRAYITSSVIGPEGRSTVQVALAVNSDVWVIVTGLGLAPAEVEAAVASVVLR